jgi:hypothetical protein
MKCGFFLVYPLFLLFIKPYLTNLPRLEGNWVSVLERYLIGDWHLFDVGTDAC